MNIGQYSKFVVGLFGATATTLTTYYGSNPPHWLTLVLTLGTAVSVYLVPNAVSTPKSTGNDHVG